MNKVSQPRAAVPAQKPVGHTPGPWTYLKRRTLLHVESAMDACVAGEPVCSLPVSKEANARLIAVAPELLAMLKLGAELMPLGTHARGEWTAKAARFIAKAEGYATNPGDHAPGAADDKPWFRNFYRCTCGHAWHTESDCTCDDRCPVCNAETVPHHSEDAS